eukprot:1367648-Prymnesium_polylepis.4
MAHSSLHSCAHLSCIPAAARGEGVLPTHEAGLRAQGSRVLLTGSARIFFIFGAEPPDADRDRTL